MQDKQKVTLYLPPELHYQLKVRAAVDMETMTDLAQRAISFYLEHSEVVESYQRYGQTHRTYSCPSCTAPVVLRDGDMVALSTSIASVIEEGLSVGEVCPVSAHPNGPAGHEQLVPC